MNKLKYSALIITVLAMVFPLGTHAMMLAPSWFPTDCCSNVIFIPGLEASHLYQKENGLLGTSTSKLWEPHRNDNVRSLFLDNNGKSINPSIYTDGIINAINVLGVNGGDIYKDFSNTMDQLVAHHTINAWKAMPYDWRLNINDIATKRLVYATTTTSIVNEIVSMASSSQTQKVTIIAHSNGGLVAKALMNILEQQGRTDLIDKLIFVAVPELGTPSAIGALLHGLDQSLGGGLLLSSSVARQFAENMASAYTLLPSFDYFKKINEAVITIPKEYQAASAYETFTNFLAGKEGRNKPEVKDTLSPNILNEKLLSISESIHSSIDEWLPPSGIKFIHIAGWGMHTLSGIKYTAENETSCNSSGTLCSSHPSFMPQPTYSSDGDATVVSQSALGGNKNSDNYFLNLDAYNKENKKSREHKDIMEVPPVLNSIKNIITDTDTIPQFITQQKPDPLSIGDTIQVSMHSPALVHLYDKDGNHTGPIPNPDPTSDLELYETNIPNSYYEHFGEAVYAGFPDQALNKIELEGTGFGTFTFNVDRVRGDKTIASTTFENVPVTPSLKAHLSFGTSAASPEILPALSLDVDGNGEADVVLNNLQSDPLMFLTVLQKTLPQMGLNGKELRKTQKKIDKIEKMLTKEKTEKALSLIIQFSDKLKNKKWSTKHLSEDEIHELGLMLDALLNSF